MIGKVFAPFVQLQLFPPLSRLLLVFSHSVDIHSKKHSVSRDREIYKERERRRDRERKRERERERERERKREKERERERDIVSQTILLSFALKRRIVL